jgi:hypothetical protein
LREKRAYEEELAKQEKRYKERKMEGKPKLTREQCKTVFLKSLDDTEVFYGELLRLARSPTFLDHYKQSSLELQDQLWANHGITQEELNYWMEKYALKDDLECLQKYEKVYESDTANQLTRAYTEASIMENVPEENLSQED